MSENNESLPVTNKETCDNNKLSPLAYKEIDGSEYPSVIPASESPAEFTVKAILATV